MRRPARKVEPRRTPHNTNCGRDWWYEDKRGISVYAHQTDPYMAAIVEIPWKALLSAAKRCGK